MRGGSTAADASGAGRIRAVAAEAWPLLACVAFLLVAEQLGPFPQSIIIQVLGVAAASLGYNLMFGTAGQISMGSAAFLAIGAFTAMGLRLGFHAPFLIAVVGAAAAAAAIGTLIGLPSLRLSSHYILFSTLSLHFIVIYALTQLQGSLPGWAMPPAGLGWLTDGVRGWLVVYAVVFFTVLWVVRHLRTQRPGRIWVAIRENASGAAIMGIDVVRWRLAAFAFGALVFGLVGALQGFYIGYVSVESFTFDLVILYVAVVLVGGLDSMVGSVVGSVTIVGIPYLVAAVLESPLLTGFPALQQQQYTIIELVYGLLLMGVILVEPGGVAEGLRRLVRATRRERRVTAARPAPLTASSVVPPAAALSRSNDALEVRGLTVTYGSGSPAVDRISFVVPEGTVVTLIGPNGAGKTSTLRSIAGFLARERVRVDAERIAWRGRELRGRHPADVAASGVSFVPERDKVFRGLSVDANIAGRLPAARDEREKCLDEIHSAFPALRALGRRSAGLLSGGERQMLALAMAMADRPSLLIVDEASLGLAPISVSQLAVSFKRLRAMGITILLAEQNVRLALEVSDSLYALSVGRIVDAGPASEWDDERLRDAYLGVAPVETTT